MIFFSTPFRGQQITTPLGSAQTTSLLVYWFTSGFDLPKAFPKKYSHKEDFSTPTGITFTDRSYIWIRKRKRRDKLYGVSSNEGGNPGL